MIPRELLDSADIPGGGGQIKLFRRGADYSIMLGGNELMNSRLSGSEEALSTLSCDALAGRRAPRFLIGGLGMGFTLRAALAELGPDARLTVVELVPAVIAWAHGPMATVFGTCLGDPRVTIAEGDVGASVALARGDYDAILLDVDNGPDGLTRAGNDRLYNARGLEQARAALAPGGVLAIWSAAPDRGFVRRLEEAGFTVTEHVVRGHKAQRGARHVVWIAVRR